MAGKNRNIVIIAAAVAVVAVGGYFFLNAESDTGTPEPMAANAPEGTTPAGTQSQANAAKPTAGTPADPIEGLPELPEGMTEMIMGDPDAPVTLIEFASLTCGHCATFATERLPELKEKYIDTGKVRYVLRDFPLDGLALRASMIARCAGPDKYFAYIDAFFHQQSQWLTETPLEDLKRVARFSGMSTSEIDACLADQELSQGIVTMMQEAGDQLDVRSTPTFILAGAQFAGTREMSHYEGLIDAALEKAGVSTE